MAATLPNPIRIDKGATLRGARFRYGTRANDTAPTVPVDLTGCVIRAYVREFVGADEVLHRFTTADGSITLDDQTQLPVDGLTGRGWYTLQMSAAVSAALTWSKGVIQLEIEFLDGTVVRHWNGKIKVSDEVTYGV